MPLKTLADQLANPTQDNVIWVRLMAAILVIYGHSFALSPQNPMQLDLLQQAIPGTYAGAIGIDVFFVLSGLLICHSWRRHPNVGRFCASRLRRIFPGLLVCILLTTFIAGPSLSSFSLQSYFLSMQTWKYLLGNASLLFVNYQLPGVFDSNPMEMIVNGSLWSLPVEVACYLMLLVTGMICLSLPNVSGHKTLFSLGLLLMAAVLLIPELSFPVLDVRRAVALFSMGAVMSLYATQIQLRARIWLPILLLAWLGTWLFAWDSWAATMCRAILVVAATLLASYRLPCVPAPGFGDASFGVYLYGFLIQQICMQIAPTASPHQLFFATLPLSLIAGIASYQLIEKRFLRRVIFG